MSELIVPTQSKFQCDAECFDRHNRYGANGRTDGDVNERVLLSVDRCNSINHDCREDRHG